MATPSAEAREPSSPTRLQPVTGLPCLRPGPADGAAANLIPYVTVILNTSPVRAHPSTRLLEEVVESFAWVPGLLACRLILVADGYKLRERDEHKSGIVSPGVAAAYRRYLIRVDRLTQSPGSALAGAELLVLEERHGCAHALRRALSLVTTPLILVVQHDRPFCAAVDLRPLVDAMRLHEGSVNTIGLVTPTTRDYEKLWISRGVPNAFFRSRTLVVAASTPVRLVPIVAILDSTHLASAAWLRARVFGPEMRTSLPVGCFLEDTLGQAQLAELRADPSSHAWYGTYLASPGLGAPVLVTHLNGRDSLADLAEWRKWRFAERHTSDAEWASWERETGTLVAGTSRGESGSTAEGIPLRNAASGGSPVASGESDAESTPSSANSVLLSTALPSDTLADIARYLGPSSRVVRGFYDAGQERRTWAWSLARPASDPVAPLRVAALPGAVEGASHPGPGRGSPQSGVSLLSGATEIASQAVQSASPPEAAAMPRMSNCEAFLPGPDPPHAC